MAATLVSFRTQGFGVEGALVISLACLLGDDIKKQLAGSLRNLKWLHFACNHYKVLLDDLLGKEKIREQKLTLG
jgi:hypothetical protein